MEADLDRARRETNVGKLAGSIARRLRQENVAMAHNLGRKGGFFNHSVARLISVFVGNKPSYKCEQCWFLIVFVAYNMLFLPSYKWMKPRSLTYNWGYKTLG